MPGESLRALRASRARHSEHVRIQAGQQRIPEQLDAVDRELLTFFLSWRPYGRPPAEDILPRFGFLSDELEPRVRAVVMANRDRNLHTDDRVPLLRVLATLNCQSQAEEGRTAATNFEPDVRTLTDRGTARHTS
jgi:hypothetical protein